MTDETSIVADEKLSSDMKQILRERLRCIKGDTLAIDVQPSYRQTFKGVCDDTGSLLVGLSFVQRVNIDDFNPGRFVDWFCEMDGACVCTSEHIRFLCNRGLAVIPRNGIVRDEYLHPHVDRR